MKRLIVTAAALVAVAALLSLRVAQAQQNDVTPRKEIDPWDRAAVNQVQAKRWLGFGSTQRTTDTTMVPSAVGAKVCVTNVGTTQAPSGPMAPRYGPQSETRNERIVVVNGNVINLCK
ncbi:hypothetical protein [Tahibacter amnicola]|uniref:Uncharacterized protein n=1 Tax=Tahibacter amnicola TaxID=2976241 RepID=A0ABY6B9N6_9GAMM|nr:hypothetical protein [Tahibacter amnicola]UXI66570.1 hypothetical protein N4264_17680 [Tahibacter amnicola]